MNDLPTLLLLPGMDGTGDLFAPFTEALGSAVNVKVVRYPLTEALSYAELASFARAALPADGPFFILGESFSGPIAVALAAEAGPRLQGLVLCCSFVRNPQPIFSGLGFLVKALPVRLVPIAVLAFFLTGRFSTPALRSALSNALSKVSPEVLKVRLLSVLAVDVSTKLAAINAPVLYLRALHDRVVPAAASRLVKHICPQTRRVDVDAPHFLLQARPIDAAQIISTFLQDQAG